MHRFHSTNFGRAVAWKAPTEVAAHIVGGSTLHSTFVLPIEKCKTGDAMSFDWEALTKRKAKVEVN